MPTILKNKHTFEIRQADSFNHAIKIIKPFGSLDRIIDWAKDELKDEWRWQVVQTSTDRTNGSYIFYFDSESDYLAFVMKHS